MVATQTDVAAARLEEAKLAKVREDNANKLACERLHCDMERWNHEKLRTESLDHANEQQVTHVQKIENRLLDLQPESISNKHAQSMSMQKQLMEMQTVFQASVIEIINHFSSKRVDPWCVVVIDMIFSFRFHFLVLCVTLLYKI